MSAYNRVSANVECPRCGHLGLRSVQFKYGNTWQIEYQVGDELQWGRSAVGKPGTQSVVVDGAVEGPCPSCGFADEWNAYVRVAEDRIVEVRTASGEYDFTSEQRNFIVLAE